MRILMVTSFPIPGEYDGTAMLPIKILRALRPRGRRRGGGLPEGAAALAGGDAAAEFEGTPIYEVPAWAWASGAGLRRIARERPFDLVHAQHYGGATRAYLACRRHGWPMVYEIHSLLGDEVERDRLGRGLVFRTYRAMEQRRAPARRRDHRPGRARQGGGGRGEGRPADRVSVIYPGIDLGEYDAPGAAGVDPRDRPRAQGHHVCRQHRASQPGGADPDRRPAAGLRRHARGALRPGGRAGRGRRGVSGPARRARRPADRPDRPDARARSSR